MAEVIRETIIRFNRDTGWLATGVVGTVIFAALVLAIQEHQPSAKSAESDLSVKANSGVIAKSSTPDAAGANPIQDGGVDPALAKTSLAEKDSSSRDESAVPAFKPEASHHERRQDGSRLRGSRIPNERNRSSEALTSTDVKRRLIELWHQSLAKNEKSRSWTAFSRFNKGAHKKAAYTAEMSH